jgi:hypothetical protein
MAKFEDQHLILFEAIDQSNGASTLVACFIHRMHYAQPHRALAVWGQLRKPSLCFVSKGYKYGFNMEQCPEL